MHKIIWNFCRVASSLVQVVAAGAVLEAREALKVQGLRVIR
jgi:hypothetical protein